MMEEKRRSRIIDYHPASVDSDLDFTTANKIPTLFDAHSLVNHSPKANQEISTCCCTNQMSPSFSSLRVLRAPLEKPSRTIMGLLQKAISYCVKIPRKVSCFTSLRAKRATFIFKIVGVPTTLVLPLFVGPANYVARFAFLQSETFLCDFQSQCLFEDK